ncbi:NYN domain-containing protein, partial [Myxococcota bacterium]|nr:NYN domain-containing protein [Myxococcota bacterium]
RFKESPTKLRDDLRKYDEHKEDLFGVKETELNSKLTTIVRQLTERSSRMNHRFNGWTTIQNSIATNTRSVEFRRAGSISYDLITQKLGTEKAVDVKLATDLIILREIYDVAIIVSGDQDYVPAVQYIKDSGKQVVNVAFKSRNGKLLPGGAWRLNMETDHSFNVPFEASAEMLLGKLKS